MPLRSRGWRACRFNRAEFSALLLFLFLAGPGGLRKTSGTERIDDAHAGLDEISTISRGDSQTVDQRRRRDEAIFDRHGFPGCAETRQQFRPFHAGVRVPGQTVETSDARVEPALQSGPLPSLGKNQNPESQFADNDGIDSDVALMCAKPLEDMRIRRWFRRLAQHVGVDQVLHGAPHFITPIVL